MRVKKMITTLSMIAFMHSYAQVGINTTQPHPSSALDIAGDNKGFLPPRITLKGTTDNVTIPDPANGLLIYNTASAGSGINTVIPGYYYWNGSMWALLANSLNTWSTSGNSGTDPQYNFIGTQDDKDLVFKRNGIISGRFFKESIGLGTKALESLSPTTRFNIGIGSFSLAKNVSGEHNVGVGMNTLAENRTAYNTAIGSSALSRVSSGDANTAVGNGASQNLIYGRMNTSIGHNSFYNGVTGSYNTGIGSYTLYNNGYGEYNTAVGVEALNKTQYGSFNTALGNKALYNLKPAAVNVGDKNVALGSNAGDNLVSGNNNIMLGADTKAVNTSGNNQLNIGNGIYGINMGSNTQRVGIGISAPAAAFHNNGTTAFTVGTQGTDKTVILLSDGIFTPPDAGSSNGVLYIIRNTGTATIKINNIVDYGSVAAGPFLLTGAVTIISNGTDWYRIQ